MQTTTQAAACWACNGVATFATPMSEFRVAVPLCSQQCAEVINQLIGGKRGEHGSDDDEDDKPRKKEARVSSDDHPAPQFAQALFGSWNGLPVDVRLYILSKLSVRDLMGNKLVSTTNKDYASRFPLTAALYARLAEYLGFSPVVLHADPVVMIKALLQCYDFLLYDRLPPGGPHIVRPVALFPTRSILGGVKSFIHIHIENQRATFRNAKLFSEQQKSVLEASGARDWADIAVIIKHRFPNSGPQTIWNTGWRANMPYSTTWVLAAAHRPFDDNGDMTLIPMGMAPESAWSKPVTLDLNDVFPLPAIKTRTASFEKSIHCGLWITGEVPQETYRYGYMGKGASEHAILTSKASDASLTTEFDSESLTPDVVTFNIRSPVVTPILNRVEVERVSIPDAERTIAANGGYAPTPSVLAVKHLRKPARIQASISIDADIVAQTNGLLVVVIRSVRIVAARSGDTPVRVYQPGNMEGVPLPNSDTTTVIVKCDAGGTLPDSEKYGTRVPFQLSAELESGYSAYNWVVGVALCGPNYVSFIPATDIGKAAPLQMIKRVVKGETPIASSICK